MGGNNMRSKGIFRVVAGAAMVLGLLSQASAEVPEIRLAKQFSMGYLQLHVMEHQKLIEKHAKLLGIPEVKVSWLLFNGPAAVNDALLSGKIDVGTGGVPGLLVVWSKSKGTPQEIRGISALSSQPVLLNSRDPNVKTIKDFKEGDHIAVPAVKVSIQAILLQMAAAKAFGEKEFAKLDTLTVSMTPPDATIALMGGKSEITAVFSVPPFQYQQIEQPDIHTVLNSFDIMGGSSTFTVAWTTAKFHDSNPVLYKALIAALKEATDIVNKDKTAAGQLWIDDSKSKLTTEMVGKIVASPQVHWTLTPENTMKFADFMAEVGTLKNKPASWKDYFFPEIYDLNGS
jgi:ABC-type nitrate/sulfonate/bicarbonate transport system substrate-binding protein